MVSFFVPHSKPTLTNSDIKSVAQVIRSGHIAQGKKVEEFEEKIAQFLNVKAAGALNSGTAALHLALLALKIKTKDEVIIPSFVCAALLNAIGYVGAKTVLVDIEKNFNLSVKEVKKKINRRTKLLIVPHMFGLPADLNELLSLGIPIIEDCAQAIGAEYKGRPVGSFGVLSIFSFYATKMITTGEGGMIASNDKRLIEKIKDLREYDKRDDYHLRYNYKMTDLQAALGINQLAQLPVWIKKRRSIAAQYSQILAPKGYELPSDTRDKTHAFYRYVVTLPQKNLSLLKLLHQKGIHAAPAIHQPLHRYLKLKGFPVSEHATDHTLSLPIYPSLTPDKLHHILSTLQILL